MEQVRQAIYAKHLQAKQIKAQKDADEKDRVTMALMQTTDPSEQLQIINNSNLSPTTKAAMSRQATRAAKQAQNYYGFGASDVEAKHFWKYEQGYQYIADTKKYAEWYAAYKNPNVDPNSKEYKKLQKEANAATSRLNNLLEFKKERNLIPSDKQTTQSSSGKRPDDDVPVLSKKDSDLAELKIYINSNPVNSAGIPLDEDQLHAVVEKYAIRNGLDVNDIEKEVFG